MDKSKVKKIAWKVVYNVAELILIAIGVLTFSGEKYIGFNLPKQLFLVALALFLIYPVYHVVLKIFDCVEKTKEGLKK